MTGRGPSLVGVGESATYFQVSTGRMPATGQGAEENRKPSKFTEAAGPRRSPRTSSRSAADRRSRRAACASTRPSTASWPRAASCSASTARRATASTGKGAPLSAGKVAPSLNDATDKQIYAAMQSGPENMPVFSDNQLTPEQKKEIITYIQTLKASKDPGGNGIDRIGPVSEGLVIWVLGIGFMVGTILWIGAKS